MDQTLSLLERGPASAPYWGLDTSPYIGNNFYRIKQVDKNGTISYSVVINVYYQPALFNVSVYPNPVTDDVLNIKINAATAEQYLINLTDITGRKVYEGYVQGSGIQTTINLSSRASQLYILTIRNNKNEIVTTQKVIKR